jgi:hypothetical protein
VADFLSVKRVLEDLEMATKFLGEGDLKGVVINLEAALGEVVSHQRGSEVVVTYVRPLHTCLMLE